MNTALAASQGYSIELPHYSQSFVLPFRNRKQFKQTPMPSRSYFQDIEDLKVGDVVRCRFFYSPAHDSHWEQRHLATVVSAAHGDSQNERRVVVRTRGGHATVFQDEVLEVIKNPRTQA